MSQKSSAIPAEDGAGKASVEVLDENLANEHVFAVVGHVGSGTSTVATALAAALKNPQLLGGVFDVVSIRASAEIATWAKAAGRPLPSEEKNDIDRVTKLQNLGDDMRRSLSDNAAVARAIIIKQIPKFRAERIGTQFTPGVPVVPDGARRAYIIESIRHPEEVNLLRRVYGQNFTLIGVVCDENVRRRRIQKKYKNAGDQNAKEFMKRDEDDSTREYGQHVGDTFHEADYFIDNTEDRFTDDKHSKSNPHWTIPDDMNRLVKIICHSEVVRPTTSETAMNVATAAKYRSACMSRQVGAALVDEDGNIVSTGTNEVPKAGGGVYGQGYDDSHSDDRCVYGRKVCSNTIEQLQIINDLVDAVINVYGKDVPVDTNKLTKAIRKTRVGSLLEFSRAVHAELDSILSAARQGHSLVGTRLYVTTFPCHYCARHIVAAGIDEVQYIEPYPKSMALRLHDDSISTKGANWKTPRSGGKSVLFRPFVGVAPRMYSRAFMKERDLKLNETGAYAVGHAEWGGQWDLKRLSYVQLEAELYQGGDDGSVQAAG